MYIPHQFRFDDQEAMIAFMRQYSFATIVTQSGNRPMATHIPFVVESRHDQLILTAHIALANEQASTIESGNALVIFTGPHAYISPAHYDKVESVPTWNYVAVHAYGKATVLREDHQVRSALEKMIRQYEPAYLEQWKHLPEKFKAGMARGIVAFELQVDELQGQKKLSQHKTDAERARIAAHLQQQDRESASALGAWMAKL